MTAARRAGPPRGPILALLAAWAAGNVPIALATAAAWRAVPGGAAAWIARPAWVLFALAQSVALYYLLGFVLKSLHSLRLPVPLAARDGVEADSDAGAAPVVVLYLTAGDFDAAALDSLLRLRLDGPGWLVVHDDGSDVAARHRIRAFVDAHPERARWSVDVWHREQRVGGKAGAVNWVLDRIDPRWELLLLCDSDSIALDTGAWRAAWREFDDPSVAVVQFRNAGCAEPDEPPFQRQLTRAIDVFDVFAAPQAAWGYLPFFGHNALVRTASLRALGGLTPGFFSDDLDFSVRLTLAGQKVVYRRDIAFGERHPADWLAFHKRSRKWAFGCMQVIRARALKVLTTRGVPLAHRVGLLEFMGFYPAQALLVLGLAMRHFVLPWIQAVPASPADAWIGSGVVALLLLPTLVWAWREHALRAWPLLAWSCVVVYGGSVIATALGVRDGMSTRPRPWIPTNLSVRRPAVPGMAWGYGLLGLALVAIPWWRGDTLLDSPASYLFAATFFLAPLTAAIYRAPEEAPPVRAAAASARVAPAIVLALAFVAAGGAPSAARAGDERAHAPRLVPSGANLELDGKPFQVRGMHYGPWLPGTGPGGAAPYPGPSVVDPDLDRIRALGVNTILVDGAPSWVARHAWARGMVTIYSFNIAWNDTTQAAFEARSGGIVAAIDSLRGTPGIVAWLIGHEVPDWVVTDLGRGRVEGRLRELATRVKQDDPTRPIGHGNWPPTRQLDLSFLDLACFNVYPAWPYEVAVRGYGPYLRDVLVPAARGKPLLITEFGINSLEAGEARQGDVIASCWSDIAGSPTAGGVLFEWCDEWWKNYDNPIAASDPWKRQYDPGDAARHDADTEEYYGIVRADRSPKPAYAAVQRMWSHAAPARPWLPWAVVIGLALVTYALLRGARGDASTKPAARTAAGLAWFVALATLGASAAPARAATWTTVDTLAAPADADAQFGWSVADGGDFDGDGRDELAVGAHFADVNGLAAAGAVSVYRGGWGPSGAPWRTLLGGQANEHFGESIAGRGDVDGDGIPDLAVGAPLRGSSGLTANGGVDLFRGPGLDATPWVRLEGEASDDWFGQSVALGDVDGDGIADIIVGAPYNDRGGSAAGAVFVYRGGASPPAAPWKVLVGEATNDQFGWSVAYVGDVNGDGYGDIVVGARLHGTGLRAAAGRAYLFLGGPAMSTVAAGTWNGEQKDDWFGNSVAGVGDADGGGRPDILVGAPYNDRGGSASGAAYLFRGEDAPGSAPLVVFVGESANAQFGWSVAGAGDVDGDGRPDVVVGARQAAGPAGAAAGRIDLFAGASHPSTTPLASASGEAANDWLGNAVCGATQYLSLGCSPAIAGAQYSDASALSAGRAYAFGMGALTGVAPAVVGGAGWRAAPDPAWSSVRFLSAAGTAAPVRIEIRDLRGRLVRTLIATGGAPTWNLADGLGRRVPAGMYLARVIATGAAPTAVKLFVTR